MDRAVLLSSSALRKNSQQAQTGSSPPGERLMTFKSLLAAAFSTTLLAFGAQAASLTIGFSQIGSESGWRAAETTVSKAEAKKRGINFKVADAQQKQENQIKAIRSFVAQGVDAIFLAPVVS